MKLKGISSLANLLKYGEFHFIILPSMRTGVNHKTEYSLKGQVLVYWLQEYFLTKITTHYCCILKIQAVILSMDPIFLTF